jgi:hypothetical protein
VLEQDRERTLRCRDEINAAQRKRRKSDPEFRAAESLRRFRCRLRRVYGLTIEDYDRMLVQQGHACTICRRKSDDKLHIDHCHATNTVRGLLCRKCNTGLGNFDDDPDRLREGAAYGGRARPPPLSGGESKGTQAYAPYHFSGGADGGRRGWRGVTVQRQGVWAAAQMALVTRSRV